LVTSWRSSHRVCIGFKSDEKNCHCNHCFGNPNQNPNLKIQNENQKPLINDLKCKNDLNFSFCLHLPPLHVGSAPLHSCHTFVVPSLASPGRHYASPFAWGHIPSFGLPSIFLLFYQVGFHLGYINLIRG